MATNARVFLAEFYQPLLRYFCRASGRPDVAEDLTQEVFVRASRSAAPVGSRSDAQAWLFRIARNLVIDHHRRNQRAPAAVSVDDIAVQRASQDVGYAVNAALKTLADLDRDVFLMREVAGLGYMEIAAVCDITPAAVRSRIHRARLHLREQLSAPVATHRTMAMRLRPRSD